MKFGRNVRCPCGSGKKYKHCHGNPSHPDFETGEFVQLDKIDMDEKWEIFLEEMLKILRVGAPEDWHTARREFRSHHVTSIYKAYKQIFPATLDIIQSITPQKRTLSALYAGDISPNEIARNILRVSLYTEKIYVFDPFHSPYMMFPGGSSIRTTPDSFLSETWRSAYFCYRMYPWLISRVVSFVPNPSNFDMNFRELDIAQVPATEALLDIEALHEERQGHLLDAFVLTHHRFSGPFLRRAIRSEFPDMPDDLVENLAALTERRARRDPDLLPPHGIQASGSQFYMARGGASPPTIISLASLLNAFPYTDSPVRSRLIQQLAGAEHEAASSWTPLAQAFRALDFQFLDKVDPAFAVRLREDGRLANLRGFLFRIWQAQKEPTSISDAQAEVFSAELREQYRLAHEEWDSIRLDMLKFLANNTTAALLAGGLVLGLSAVVAFAPSVYKVHEYMTKIRRFRLLNPMSVLIDLDRRR